MFISSAVYSQLGIGTTNPNSSSVLDIDVSTLTQKKGLSLPNVALLNNTDQTTIQNPAIGLMVYNTKTNGTGNNTVTKDMYYYWNGVNWVNLSTLTEVKNELLPQVFSIAEVGYQVMTDVNTKEVKVIYSPSAILLNTGNNILLDDDSDSNFEILNEGVYEVSGFINYNPGIPLTYSTNIEFIIQSSEDGGLTWVQKAKTIGVWGLQTTMNNRTTNIPPTVINLNKNDLLRFMVKKTQGQDHSSGAAINAPTGLAYGKVLKIQKLN